MTSQSGKSEVRIGGVEDAHRLHAAGYTRRAVHAKWVLDAYAILHGLFTDDGEPLKDNAEMDSSFYLSAEEWDTARIAAQTIVNLAPAIAQDREAEARGEVR